MTAQDRSDVLYFMMERYYYGRSPRIITETPTHFVIYCLSGLGFRSIEDRADIVARGKDALMIALVVPFAVSVAKSLFDPKYGAKRLVAVLKNRLSRAAARHVRKHLPTGVTQCN